MPSLAHAQRIAGTDATPASALSAATGVGLYLLTLTGEGILGASTRWLLAYLAATIALAIFPLGIGAEQIALVVAFAPLAWSVLGLLFPGRGSMWRRWLGARSPTSEEAMVIEDARQMLRGVDPSLSETSRVCVLDDPLPMAAARGLTVVLSRGLLESDAVPAVLTHELGHTRSLGGRLTEALERLEPWGDPLAPLEPRAGADARAARAPDRGGLVLGCLTVQQGSGALLAGALREAGGPVATAPVCISVASRPTGGATFSASPSPTPLAPIASRSRPAPRAS